MNIFILNTGRCGSMTLIEACKHITNYTSAHESLCTNIGELRLYYPENHIEADNRLCWLLGRLDQAYGNDAFYVHLQRDKYATAESFTHRDGIGIMQAYREGILMDYENKFSAHDIASDYIDTAEANIRLFLKYKTNTMNLRLESARDDFIQLWNNIQAEGDLQAALSEWDTQYNATP